MGVYQTSRSLQLVQAVTTPFTSVSLTADEERTFKAVKLVSKRVNGNKV